MTGIKIDEITYHENGSFEGIASFILNRTILARLNLVNLNIDLAWCGKAEEGALLKEILVIRLSKNFDIFYLQAF